MDNFLIKSTKYDIKPLGDNFYSLVEDFLSDNFVLTEQNIENFLRKLHRLDYANKYEKMFTVKVRNSVLTEGDTNFGEKQIVIAVNKLLNIDKNASNNVVLSYKLALLNSYFHEARHEKQYEICKYRGLDSTLFNKVMTYEFTNMNTVYNQFSSLIEVDARMVSIERIVDLTKKIDVLKNPDIYSLVLYECVSLLDGLNDNGFEIKDYQTDPFSCEKMLNKIKTQYKNQPSKFKFQTKEFADDFTKEFQTKLNKFKEETLRYLMFNIVSKVKFDSKIAKIFDLENDKNAYVKFFFNDLLTYDNAHFGNFIRLLSQKTREEAKEIIITQEDIEEFLQFKNIELTERNIANFYNNDEMHIEFEKYLKNKQNGYNALFDAIIGEREN